jgi:hypothetical protein
MGWMTQDKQHLHAFLGGVMTSLYNAVQAADIYKTCILAATGATVSYLVTYILKIILARFTGKRKSR